MDKYNRYIFPILSWLFVLPAFYGVAKSGKNSLPEAWVEPMSQVHQKFQGVQGTFAHFGDSITVTMAFWTPLLDERQNAPPEMETAYSLVKGYMQNQCWRDWKGSRYGNQGGMTIRWAHQHIDDWLEGLNPEVALIMFGTNDLNSVPLPEYRQKLRDVIRKCLANGTIVILSTIPPRHRMAEKAAQYSKVIREIARDMKVPLSDFYKEILERRCEDWDGALEKFSSYQGYDVPTLIARDGVHPSHPKRYRNDYSPEALKHCGYSLRNYLTLLKYAEVIEWILQKNPKPPTTPFSPDSKSATKRPEITCSKTVPREKSWGIYGLNISTQQVRLVYSSSVKLSTLRLSHSGKQFVFSQKLDGKSDTCQEICTLNVDGSNFRRLTKNTFSDFYPAWSPDDAQIAFLSRRRKNLDIYLMSANGSQVRTLYDSGSHDADIHWVRDRIVFTSRHRIWIMKDDGANPQALTNPPRAGQWGKTNLPFGDFDPSLSPDGKKIVFERLEKDDSPHGNYNLFVIDADGSHETRLTNNGYTQGLANWSHSGDKIVCLVTAIGKTGKYDIFLMNADGSHYRNITPDYFPPTFLCHSPIFSLDDTEIYFVGQWWK